MAEQHIPQVVVLDDSPASLVIYGKAASALSVTMMTFSSPQAGLDYLADVAVDLVFLDYLMQDMDGATLLRRLRDLPTHQDTPVVVVTSKDYAQDRVVARQWGVVDYLVKPVRSQEISETISRHTRAGPTE